MTMIYICVLGTEKYLRKASQPLTFLKSFLHFTDNDHHEQHLTVQMFNLPQMPQTNASQEQVCSVAIGPPPPLRLSANICLTAPGD